MKTFDPNVLFDVLPSFYREQLNANDKALIGTFWEGLVRLSDCQYSRLFQLVAAQRIHEATVNIFQPWVYQEFDSNSWEVRGSRHLHTIIRLIGNEDAVFYLRKTLDPTSLRIWYDGKRVDIGAPSVITNEPNGYQWLNPSYVGTRIDVRKFDGNSVIPDSARFDNSNKQLVIEGYELIDPIYTFDGSTSSITPARDDGFSTVDSEIDSATLTAEIYRLNLLDTGLTIDDAAAEYPVFSLPDGFKRGQVIEIVRTSGNAHKDIIRSDSTTFTPTLSKTQAGGDVVYVFLVTQIQLWPNPVTVESTSVSFPKPLPVGTRVRISDPSGVQSYTTEAPTSVITLSTEVDPSVTSVFVHNIDLANITVTDGLIDFGRNVRNGILVNMSARFKTLHDHAIFSYTALSTIDSVSLPSTRPLALNADLTESNQYPIRVYKNGLLLPTTAYSITSTTVIEFIDNLVAGDSIDVIYTDAEDPVEHIHVRGITESSDIDLTAVQFSEKVDGRYPIVIEKLGTSLVDPSGSSLSYDGIIVSVPNLGTGKIYYEGAVVGNNFRYVVPGRADDSENWKGTIVSAESLQDGIDDPTVSLSGDNLVFTRLGDDTQIDTAEKLEIGWFKNVQIDEHTLSEVLGVPLGLPDSGESTERYRRLLISLYAASMKGSQTETIENFACIVLGSEFAPRDGVDRGAIQKNDQSRVRRIEFADGTVDEIQLSAEIPDRLTVNRIPLFHAVSEHCTVIDQDLSVIPWLAFFAESVSPDYRYAKRMDVRVPYEFTATPTSYDKDTFILTDLNVDFIENEVWVNDLIYLTTTGVTVGSVSAPVSSVYARVEQVIDAHSIKVTLQLTEIALGWGQPDGWGETVGWGGFLDVDGIAEYTIWTRKTRKVDSHLFHDEMFNSAQALCDGESVQHVNSVLSELLKHFMFGIKIKWAANKDGDNLKDLSFLLTSIKPADTGYFAWTEVNDDEGIKDSVTAEVYDHGIVIAEPTRNTFIGYGYIGSMFVGANVIELSLQDVDFDINWWTV